MIKKLLKCILNILIKKEINEFKKQKRNMINKNKYMETQK